MLIPWNIIYLMVDQIHFYRSILRLSVTLFKININLFLALQYQIGIYLGKKFLSLSLCSWLLKSEYETLITKYTSSFRGKLTKCLYNTKVWMLQLLILRTSMLPHKHI